MSRVGVFHIGLQHACQTARAFAEAGQLEFFATTRLFVRDRAPYRQVAWFDPTFSSSIGQKLLERREPEISDELVHLYGGYEFLEIGLKRLGLLPNRGRLGDLGYKYFSNAVVGLAKRRPIVDVVWGFNGYALSVFEQLKPLGVRCVLDMTIGHMREYERLRKRVEAEGGSKGWYVPSDSNLRRQDAELAMADRVVVGSEFVRSTLLEEGIDQNKIVVCPYGFDGRVFRRDNRVQRRLSRGEKLKLVFVGQIDPRKGADVLVQAVRRFLPSQVHLTLVGSDFMDLSELADEQIEIIPHVSRFSLPDLLNSKHCFVLPSLFEGSALVVYEAVATGAPVVYTQETGHPSSLQNGMQVRSGSVDDLAICFSTILENPSLIEDWSHISLGLYDELEWSEYRRRARSVVDELNCSDHQET